MDNIHQVEKEQITYDWFRAFHLIGQKLEKDDFLQDRDLWDDLQKSLMAEGYKMTHDPVKKLVRSMDKQGWFGGIGKDRDYAAQVAFMAEREKNKKETGHTNGFAGILADLERYGKAVSPRQRNEEYKAYLGSNDWYDIAHPYKVFVNWTCELCLKKHIAGSSKLDVHHLTYTFPDGTSALGKETPEILMAVCHDVCHPLADIARCARDGGINSAVITQIVSEFAHLLRR